MREIILFIVVDIAWLAAIIALTLIPLKFNLSIIPAIEKKMGVKLSYSKLYKAQAIGTYGRYAEIALYITSCYVLYCMGIDDAKFKNYASNYALSKINYSVEKFSRREIVWGFFAIINLVLVFLCVGIAIFLK